MNLNRKGLLLCGLLAVSSAFSMPQSVMHTVHVIGMAPIHYHLKQVHCPSPSQLVQDPATRRWSVPGEWKGNTLSMAHTMTTFLGAQWQGVNLGQPFCVYRGMPKDTFSIVLAYHAFALTPVGGLWKGNPHHNLYHCFSHDTTKCPFQTRLKPKASSLANQLASIVPGHHADQLASRGF